MFLVLLSSLSSAPGAYIKTAQNNRKTLACQNLADYNRRHFRQVPSYLPGLPVWVSRIPESFSGAPHCTATLDLRRAAVACGPLGCRETQSLGRERRLSGFRSFLLLPLLAVVDYHSLL